MKPLTYVFVTGGRDYPDRARVWAALDTLAFLYGDLCVIQGACRGADLMAEAWAKDRQHDYVGCPAKWDRDGKKAGYDRNKETAFKRLIAFMKSKTVIHNIVW